MARRTLSSVGVVMASSYALVCEITVIVNGIQGLQSCAYIVEVDLPAHEGYARWFGYDTLSFWLRLFRQHLNFLCRPAPRGQ